MSAGPEIAIWILLTICAATDLLWGKIFNIITLPFFFVGLGYQAFHGGLPAVSDGLLSVGVAVAVFFPLYLLRVMAAGDVKLLMATGAWASASVVLQIAGISILLGAAVGLVTLVRHQGVFGGVRSLRRHASGTNAPGQSLRMPFAPGFLCAYFIIRIAELRQWQLL